MEPASEKAYRTLVTQIASGELRPGEPISVRSVSADLSISRTPARDALLRLQQEGLVEVDPVLGNVVRQWTLEEQMGRLDVRWAIEAVAIRWAARRMTTADHREMLALCDQEETLARSGELADSAQADMEFHRAVLKAGGNSEIVRAGEQNGLSEYLFTPDASYDLAVCLEMVAEHREIANALLARDAPRALRALDTHLERAARSMGKRLLAMVTEGRETAAATRALVEEEQRAVAVDV